MIKFVFGTVAESNGFALVFIAFSNFQECQPASKQASKQASQPASRPVGQPVRQPASQSAPGAFLLDSVLFYSIILYYIRL